MSELMATLTLDLGELRRVVAEEVDRALRARGDDKPLGWLDAHSAAAYLGLSVNALYRLSASRQLPVHQDGPGCKLWFKPDELDEWRRRC